MYELSFINIPLENVLFVEFPLPSKAMEYWLEDEKGSVPT